MDFAQTLQPVHRQPLSQRVANTVKRYILSENLQPSDTLPAERQLAESLVVSRTVLREALGILVGEGIITKQPGKGIFVLPFDRDQVRASFSLTIEEQPAHTGELQELRRTIEVGALSLSIPRITPAEIDRLRELVQTMQEKLAKGISIASEDAEFHLVLLDATSNSLIVQFRFLIEEMVRVTVERNPRYLREERDEEAVHTMSELVEAVVAGDVWGARRLMEEHLTLPMS